MKLPHRSVVTIRRTTVNGAGVSRDRTMNADPSKKNHITEKRYKMGNFLLATFARLGYKFAIIILATSPVKTRDIIQTEVEK